MILHDPTKTLCAVAILLATVAGQVTSSSASTDEETVPRKSKREAGGPAGLYPFPRIGRSGPDTWFLDAAGKHLFDSGRIFLDPFVPSAASSSEAINDGLTGLFPQPRVGRSAKTDGGSEQSFGKRQGLVPFPRIGRSGDQQSRSNNGGNAAAGLWFGPRLGRLHKKDSPDSPWALVTLREFPSITSRRQPEAYTPRLGRESTEDSWDDYEHQKPSSSGERA